MEQIKIPSTIDTITQRMPWQYKRSILAAQRVAEREPAWSPPTSNEKHAGRKSCLRAGAAGDFARSTKKLRNVSIVSIYNDLSCLSSAYFSEFGGIWHFDEIGAKCVLSRGMQRKTTLTLHYL